MTLKKNDFENIVGSQHFLLFPQYFLPLQRQNAVCWVTFILSSANAFNSDKSKNLLFGKVLTHYHTIPSINDPVQEGYSL